MRNCVFLVGGGQGRARIARGIVCMWTVVVVVHIIVYILACHCCNLSCPNECWTHWLTDWLHKRVKIQSEKCFKIYATVKYSFHPSIHPSLSPVIYHVLTLTFSSTPSILNLPTNMSKMPNHNDTSRFRFLFSNPLRKGYKKLREKKSYLGVAQIYSSPTPKKSVTHNLDRCWQLKRFSVFICLSDLLNALSLIL